MRKVIKPGQAGVLFKPYRYRGQDRLVVSALLFFEIGGEASLLAEYDGWQRLMPYLGPMQVLDECMPKPGAEILVAGEACAPEGQAVSQMEVRLRCAAVDKTLHILGERDWRYGLIPLRQIDEPQPFTRMPIDWQHAWGGEGCKTNPQGRGFTDSRLPAFRGANQGRMPTVQYPGERLKPGRRNLLPAGFGPLPMDVKQRRQYSGRYNKQWLKEDFPGLARNIDRRFFHMAPQDQWLKHPFSGDETFTLEGMHAHRVLQGGLPQLQPRAFVGNAEEPCREVALTADTLWLFPQAEMGVLIWHGETPISHSDALDMEHLMLALEPRNRPRSLGYYEEVLSLRTDPATAEHHAFNEAQLMPPVDSEKGSDAAAEDKRQTEQAARTEAWMDDFRQRYPMPPLPEIPDSAADVVAEAEQFRQQIPRAPKIPVPTEAQMAAGQIDLGPMFQAAEQAVEDAEARLAEEQKKLEEELGPQPQPEPLSGKEAIMRADPEKRRQEVGQQCAALELEPEQTEQMQQQFEQLLSRQQQVRRYQREPSAKPLSRDAVRLLATLIRQRLRQGLPLAEYDLSGVQLSGVDFSGCDLTAVSFEGAQLTDCNFSGAQLEGGCFLAARLHGCRFDQSQLTATNWAQAQLENCCFNAALLVDSQWSETRLNDCDLVASDLSQAIFNKPKLHRTDLTESRLDGSLWLEVEADGCCWSCSRGEGITWLAAALSNCDFSAVEWYRSAWLNCTLLQADWRDAQLQKVLITGAEGNSNWTGSNWQGARLIECGLRGTLLDRSQWQQAHLNGCDLGSVSMHQVDGQEALFSQCVMTGAQLQQADLKKADLYGSLLRQVNLREADLRQVQAWGTDFSDGVLIDARTDGLWPEINSPGVQRRAA